MDDTYQAVFDAVRSRISGFDGHALIERIASQFDFSFYAQQIKEEIMNVTYEHQRPSVIFRPSLKMDNGRWRAVYGDVMVFGNSPQEAMLNFDNKWVE